MSALEHLDSVERPSLTGIMEMLFLFFFRALSHRVAFATSCLTTLIITNIDGSWASTGASVQRGSLERVITVGRLSFGSGWG